MQCLGNFSINYHIVNYHIVLVTKYRNRVLNRVLTGDIERFVKEQVPIICARYEWETLALEVMPKHVHLFVSAGPLTAPNTIAKTLKSILTVAVFREFPTLKARRFWGSGLWSDGCYYGSAGAVSTEIIKRYIENQKDA